MATQITTAAHNKDGYGLRSLLNIAVSRLKKKLLLPLFLISGYAVASQPTLNLQTLVLETAKNRQTIQAELALTAQQRSLGLMYRSALPAGHGMLFVYATDEPFSMWMANTYFSLDMLFFDKSGLLIGVTENAVPLSRRPIKAPPGTRAVLEVNAGVVRQMGLQPGGTRIARPAMAPLLARSE